MRKPRRGSDWLVMQTHKLSNLRKQVDIIGKLDRIPAAYLFAEDILDLVAFVVGGIAVLILLLGVGGLVWMKQQTSRDSSQRHVPPANATSATPNARLVGAQTGAWTSRAPMPTPRIYAGFCVLSNKLYVFGGEYKAYGFLTDKNEAYDPVSDTWASLAPLPLETG